MNLLKQEYTSLVTKMANNDWDAYEQLLELTAPQLCKFVNTRLRQRETTRQMLTEVYICIWKDRTRITGVEDAWHCIEQSINNQMINKKKARIVFDDHFNYKEAVKGLELGAAQDAQAARELKLRFVRKLSGLQQDIYILARWNRLGIGSVSREYKLAPSRVIEELVMAITIVQVGIIVHQVLTNIGAQ